MSKASGLGIIIVIFTITGALTIIFRNRSRKEAGNLNCNEKKEKIYGFMSVLMFCLSIAGMMEFVNIIFQIVG